MLREILLRLFTRNPLPRLGYPVEKRKKIGFLSSRDILIWNHIFLNNTCLMFCGNCNSNANRKKPHEFLSTYYVFFKIIARGTKNDAIYLYNENL